MASNSSQLGLFWEIDSFCFTEVNRKKIINAQYIPFDTPIDTDQPEEVPESLKHTALLQQKLLTENPSYRVVNLSLPSKSLIFRSFIIPWMQPSEMKSAVEFEVTKYIPIRLDGLAYTYHPVTITEKNKKSLRILFVAIRKDFLKKHLSILEHTGLKVNNIEPAPVSLVRSLQKHRLFSAKQSTAIIEIGKKNARIIIVERKVVQFVRDFPLPEGEELSASNTKFLNDIRVSLNFYKRQNVDGKIEKIILLSLRDLSDLANTMAEEFHIAATATTAAKILKTDSVEDIGLLTSYGLTLREKAFSSKNFDLSEKSTQLQKTAGTSFAEMINYKMLVITIFGCVLTVFLSVFLANQMISGYRSRLASLDEKQGLYRSLQTNDIEKKNDAALLKLNAYKSIHLESTVAEFLSSVPHLLPPEAWLNRWNIEYYKFTKKSAKTDTAKVSMIMEGYIYMENPTEQFRLVNHLPKYLSKNKKFAKNFNNINLVSSNQQNLQNYTVIAFKIKCK
ncbi:MAG: pilus assembly protein PilM [Candidatus Omnitrophica bacterium]|nr:pilus assembly protein PilM [Candidatus Omnitrophota bacterium]